MESAYAKFWHGIDASTESPPMPCLAVASNRRLLRFAGNGSISYTYNFTGAVSTPNEKCIRASFEPWNKGAPVMLIQGVNNDWILRSVDDVAGNPCGEIGAQVDSRFRTVKTMATAYYSLGGGTPVVTPGFYEPPSMFDCGWPQPSQTVGSQTTGTMQLYEQNGADPWAGAQVGFDMTDGRTRGYFAGGFADVTITPTYGVTARVYAAGEHTLRAVAASNSMPRRNAYNANAANLVPYRYSGGHAWGDKMSDDPSACDFENSTQYMKFGSAETQGIPVVSITGQSNESRSMYCAIPLIPQRHGLLPLREATLPSAGVAADFTPAASLPSSFNFIVSPMWYQLPGHGTYSGVVTAQNDMNDVLNFAIANPMANPTATQTTGRLAIRYERSTCNPFQTLLAGYPLFEIKSTFQPPTAGALGSLSILLKFKMYYFIEAESSHPSFEISSYPAAPAPNLRWISHYCGGEVGISLNSREEAIRDMRARSQKLGSQVGRQWPESEISSTFVPASKGIRPLQGSGEKRSREPMDTYGYGERK